MDYYGDINIEHGGIYLDFAEFKKWGDFCPCVKITNLDSACGFNGAILIECGSIYIPDDKEKRESALSCIGIESGESYNDIQLIDAFESYHGVESDTFTGPIIIQTEKDGIMTFEGFEADSHYTEKFHESGLSLREFIETEFC